MGSRLISSLTGVGKVAARLPVQIVQRPQVASTLSFSTNASLRNGSEPLKQIAENLPTVETAATKAELVNVLNELHRVNENLQHLSLGLKHTSIMVSIMLGVQISAFLLRLTR